VRLSDKVTIAQLAPNISNGTMFGNLDWPLNAGVSAIAEFLSGQLLMNVVIVGRITDPDVKNYRPISNLSVISKLLERVILRRLLEHLNVNDLLNGRAVSLS